MAFAESGTSVVVLAVCLMGGCAHSVKEIARESSRAAVDESVDELTDEDTTTQMASAIADPRVEEATVKLTDHVIEGVLKSLESERAHQQIAALTRTASNVVAQQVLASLTSAQAREKLGTLSNDLTQGVVSNLGQSLKRDFVPAFREALEGELSQAGANSLTGPLRDALGVTAQNVAYNATLGVNEGLRSSLLGEEGALRGFARDSVPLVKLAFWALALFTLCLMSIAAIVIARTRRTRIEVMRLESATLLLATAMREKHANQETEEIVGVVREALEKSTNEHRHGLLGFLRLRRRPAHGHG